MEKIPYKKNGLTVTQQIALTHGPFCLENFDLFRKEEEFEKLLKKMKTALWERKNEPFISHFKENYKDEYPPVWITIELLTLGTVSRLYNNLKTGLQKEIAKDFMVDHHLLISWLKSITELRNTCAHHTRFWNKVFVNAPKIRKADKDFPVREEGWNRLGPFIPLFSHLLKTIGENFEWGKECSHLFQSNKSISPIDLGMEDWW